MEKIERKKTTQISQVVGKIVGVIYGANRALSINSVTKSQLELKSNNNGTLINGKTLIERERGCRVRERLWEDYGCGD